MSIRDGRRLFKGHIRGKDVADVCLNQRKCSQHELHRFWFLFDSEKKMNTNAERAIMKKLTRKDESSVSLENFALMADDMIVWNDNE
jgi:hypothetical protein